jgi:AcrR family transcriptional regulator
MGARAAATAARAQSGADLAAPGKRGGKRRKDIFKALHDCVIEQGYAKTTLADVARAAGMSPSHLLYYFAGKDTILEHYFADVTRRIIARMEGFRGEPPERKIELLAELFFGAKSVAKSEIGFMLECFGVAVHDKQLQTEKAAVDHYCKAYLQELFRSAPCGPARARDSAEAAYAMLVGLRTAAYFDERLGPRRALTVFRNEMLARARIVRSDK